MHLFDETRQENVTANSGAVASILWRRIDRPGHEAARLAEPPSGPVLEGTAVFAEAGEQELETLLRANTTSAPDANRCYRLGSWQTAPWRVSCGTGVDMTKIKASALMLSGTIVLACSLLFAQVQRPGEYPRGVKPSPMMNFFVTSEPIGDGGNLGGLAGADAHCQTLAVAVGAGNRTWHAYLSTQARPGQPAVNARDRIGNGPW